MEREFSLQMQPRQELTLKQNQLLMMLPQMQQAIFLLQLPIMELSAQIEEELEKNPILENQEPEGEISREEREMGINENVASEKEVRFDQNDFEIIRHLAEEYRDHFASSGNFYKGSSEEEDKLRTFQENSICEKESLFTHLMKQAQETFQTPQELSWAEVIIGSLDENGFLKTSLEEISLLCHANKDQLITILQSIQTFDPIGIAAESIQQCLLIQLRHQKKQNSLAYKIIEKHYDDLLHNRLPAIQKDLGMTYQEIHEAITKTISRLDLRPGAGFVNHVIHALVPDAKIRQEGDKLIVEINDEGLPSLRLNRRYLNMLNDDHIDDSTREFIQNHLTSAKWLVRNIYQRNETLSKILNYLTDKQKEFFLSPDGKLVPLTMKEVAEELELHESTIARAVANKYVDCMRGLLPLRSFFTTAYVNIMGEDISAQTVRNAIKDLIEKENKVKPLSDESISSKLKEAGIVCARRTVAKHRHELNLGTAQQRRQY